MNAGRVGLLKQPRATQRYASVKDDQAALRSRIREIAGTHVTWGYPRVWFKLRREGWLVNRKRVYRLYREEKLCVGKHKPRRHRSSVTRPEPTTATQANENWFLSINDAKEKVASWRRHYNRDRPHSALGNLAPEEFAALSGQGPLAG